MREGLPAAPASTSADDGVRVDSVGAGTLAGRAGIAPGDRIVSVSGTPVEDLLDLHFLTSRSRFTVRWRNAAGEERERPFRAGETPLGIHPEPIRVRRCRNRCVFCFIHQLPEGLRRTLYVKDEDVRLSFLHGQYVSFSDLTDGEIRKIVRYRLSPLYVSIHTTDSALRGKMLGNPGARDILPLLRRLTRAGIALHGQIVVCPGINDGEELSRTLRGLSALRPGLRTVAVVPVGLTSHRAGLPPLRPVSREEARETLSLLRRMRREDAGKDGGEPFASAADEYHLLAGERIPGRRAYGSYAQIGNGVGLLRQFLDGSAAIFRKKEWPRGATGGTVVTGMSAAPFVRDFLREFSRRAGVRFAAVAARNRLMGESVTVTGLLGGKDIVAAVGRSVRGALYIPSVTLRDAGDLFLDGLTPADVSRLCGAPVRVFEPTPRSFLEAVYNENHP
jgi:putative radical SAM enzyme (TIGR03279 family)